MRAKIKWIVALAILLLIVYTTYSLSSYVSGNTVKKEIDVIIDPGHGGGDPGKIGVNKALEKDINLQVAKKLEKILKEEGILVAMTRETDEGLGGGGKNKKAADMKARVKMINKIKPAITISIHQNSYSAESVNGAQVFYYSHSEEGERLAKIIQQSLCELDHNNHRQAKANDTYYLLKRTEVPTVIVECGFLSNWQEAQKLTEGEYQDTISKAVCKGIMAYLGRQKEAEK